MAVITRWSYYRGGRNAGFHCITKKAAFNECMPYTSLLSKALINCLTDSASLKSQVMFFGSAVVAATNLLVLRELHELRNLPRLPIKIQFYLVLNMVTLKENIDSFVIVMFQDQRDTD